MTDKTLSERVAEVLALAEQATLGPWEVEQFGTGKMAEIRGVDSLACLFASFQKGRKSATPQEVANVNFIAAAPDMAQIIREQQAEIERLSRDLENHKFAVDEHLKRTEWIQDEINAGALPAKYLGWHRDDVAKAEIDRLRAENEVLRALVLDLGAYVELVPDDRCNADWIDRSALLTRVEAARSQS